ncbi:Protein broad-minded, partial [Ophiophagus hannah]
MSHFSIEDEALLQPMLRQLLQSVKEKITGAPSVECAEEILLHLEETDENFHKYREMMHSLKNVMMVVVESLINKFEEDQMRYKEMQRKVKTEPPNSYYADNCSDSDSSFNQSYTFMNQEQLQLLVERLDPAQPKEDKVLKFYAKTFSSSPLNMTRELYTSLAKYLEAYFLAEDNYIPSVSMGIDISNPDIIRLLKKMRLLNEYQREVSSFWIRHPEKYMEEIMESTLSLLAVKHNNLSQMASSEFWDPVYFLALVDLKAVWFKKWMHAYYSRTVVLRLLEKKYKSLIIATVEQCATYLEACESAVNGSRMFNLFSTPHNSMHYFYLLILPLLIFLDLMTLKDLIIMFTRLIYCSPNCPKPLTVHSGNYSPAGLITDILRVFCDGKECATECLYTNTVIEELLQPLHYLLKGTEVNLNCPETTLTHIADILARIAAADDGLSLLLYGGEKPPATESTSLKGAHIIAQFTKKLLDEDISVLSGSEMLPVLKGTFIFVCRQMYSTCEGLEVLLPYQLHKSIAEAWKKTSLVSDRVPTPIAGVDTVSSVNQESQSCIVLEETLLDDLLNFATTPKGLLLLQNTGTVTECVTFMFNRFMKNLQVSGCEKFGYGVIVSQVAATAPGAAALQNSGFIKALITELWGVLECGRDDVRMTHPRPTPVDPIDRSCQKFFLALINLLSCSAVYELISDQEIPNKAEYSLREVPTDVVDIIDRLIVVNTEAKIHSLFNYEQSHIFGLRLLNVLCCDLNTLLLLESQYKVSEVLLDAQNENAISISETPRQFIIDGLSVERNHILIRISHVGGPTERILPPRVLHKVVNVFYGDDPYPWPMFSSYPLPACYLAEFPRKNHSRKDDDVSKLLSVLKNPNKQMGWLENVQRQFCEIMQKKPDVISGANLAELIEKIVLHLFEIPSEHYFSSKVYEADVNMEIKNLTAIQQVGIKMTIRYGKHLNLLKENAENDLYQVLIYYNQQDRYVCYDWFVSSVFLIMMGNREKTLTFLHQFSYLLVSAFLWAPRLHNSIHLPVDTAASGIHPVYFCSAHYVEMLLKAELPLVFSAFHMSGFTSSQICQQWLTQCFWNYMDWREICHYIAICIFLGPDYQIYVCISVFKHLQQEILQHTQAQDLQVFLKEEALHGFQVNNYVEYMESLAQTYRPILLRDMRNIGVPST